MSVASPIRYSRFDPGVGRVLAGEPELHVVDVDTDDGAMCADQLRQRERHVTATTPEVEDADPFVHARGSSNDAVDGANGVLSTDSRALPASPPRIT